MKNYRQTQKESENSLNGYYQRIYENLTKEKNKELYYKTPDGYRRHDNSRHFEKKQLPWYGRMPNTRWSKRILYWQPIGRRKQRRPKWQENTMVEHW